MLLAFAVLVVLTAAAVAGGMYVQARTVILQSAQDAAALSLIEQLSTMTPLSVLPPTRAELNRLAGELSSRVDTGIAVYEDQWSRGAPDDQWLTSARKIITPELRAAVGRGNVAWQRVSPFAEPILVVGARVPYSGGRSRVEVYLYRSLLPEDQSISGVAALAWLTAGVALVAAMLLALAAARGVLNPVRELETAAARLGAGDLTVRLRVQGTDELASVAATFNNTAEALASHVAELRRMEAEARRFVADVSHELRTPLAAMAAVADVLDEEAAGLPPDAAQAASLVSQETKNLTRLVNDLIEITRFDSGTAALQIDEIDMARAVENTLRTRGWSAQVTAELPPDVSARVDPRRLDVIIANLVGNALTHGEPPVVVTLTAQEAEVTVTVADNGPGLPSEVLPNVFQRFYKADTARARSQGSGLGLSIAWENTKLHGGTLTVENGPQGAVFTLRLPRNGAVR